MTAIDTHVHVWTDEFSRYPLAPNFQLSDFACLRYEPEDILRESERNSVSKIVLVQMSYYGFDNKLLLHSIARRPDKFRGIAVINDHDKDPGAIMKRLKNQGIRGFRVVIEGRGEDSTHEPGLNAMFECGEKEKLAICTLINPQDLFRLGRLCDQYPATPVIVDHIARIGMAGPIRAQDVDALCALAEYPNVMVKISAFYALGAKAAPYLDLAPLIEHVFHAFGANRLMWGSDCPFQTLAGTYPDSIELIRDRLPFLSDNDRQQILYSTAERVFFGEAVSVHP